MTEILLVASVALNVIVLLVLFLRKQSTNLLDPLQNQLVLLEKSQEKLEKALRDEIAKNREESVVTAKLGREEMANSITALAQSLLTNMSEMSTQQKNLLDSFSKQLNDLTQMNEQKLEKVRETVERKLTLLQEDNNKKLEQMRQTVDEKLNETLEKRLGESFKLVSERLELVHKGLGEMQTLAAGVGDLKKVLTNVKTRGTLGEIQLENLLEQILSPEQYEKNVATRKGSTERVEFAIRLPGKEDSQKHVLLPIDSKFPLEDYQKLLDAQEAGDLQAAHDAAKLLETKIKQEAKTIQEKYINPPDTTDFAIMFLPIEGLFAEVLRRSGLWETLQRDYRVIITGPTTITALLNSLQMGFRTLAIQKRSSEVWQLLGAVKTEFVRFGDILDKTQKKLQEASNTIETASKKSRTIERKLRSVEELPAGEASLLLEDLELTVPE
ncbi:DNA recombination protein RmuC [Effusibacillus lacus]|uniref:DNA recombination protein RmuC n=1 Tax=Effusibacillus lacus TaxID=1348429 RepID=A0A292YS04_9BACL|nr:DNA recombination protein RmuC [Effusibacillus lacus]TCS76861.1 DNA recombination protein RmuC [Effusibacillus lacus]GAX91194.1 DNA recombination protein RmuC [Effusibacillus lacus]